MAAVNAAFEGDADPEESHPRTRPVPVCRQRSEIHLFARSEALIKEKAEPALRTLLKTHPELYNERNDFGVSLLERTIQHDWSDGMTILLGSTGNTEHVPRLRQALQLAIRYDKIGVVNTCLDYLDSIRGPRDGDIKASGGVQGMTIIRGNQRADDLADEQQFLEESSFDMRISPVSLAIVLKRRKIALLLIDRGYSELHPVSTMDEVKCKKKDCLVCVSSSMLVREGALLLEHSHTVLSTYKALCSPIFLFHSEVKDPIMELFQLSSNLRLLKARDPAFSKEYESLDEQVRLVAVELLDLCNTENEVETLLTPCTRFIDQLGVTGSVKHPIVLMAIYYNQKEFIAHPHCQHVLLRSWYNNLPRWLDTTYTSMWKVFFFGLLLAPLLPIFCFLYVLHCWPSLNRVMRIPAIRFVTDTISYSIFILLILTLVILKGDAEVTMLGDMPPPLVWCIFLYVVGLTARSVRALFRQRGFMSMNTGLVPPGHTFDFIFLSVYVVSFGLLFLQIILVRAGVNENTPRYKWSPISIRIFSEAFSSVGCIMACIRICFLFEFNRSLGTLTISLRKMTGHIVRFLFVFGIVIIAFGVALTGLYFPYKGNEAFNGFHDTFKTLFWALFGFGEASDPDLADGMNYNDTSTEKNITAMVTCVLLAVSNYSLSCIMHTPLGIIDYVGNDEAYIHCPLNESSTNPLSCWSTMANISSPLCHAGDFDMLDESVAAHLPMQCDYSVYGYPEEKGPKHRLTEVVGYVMYGFYNVLAVIILLNMLIATMANCYTYIEANSDQEWKFARARMLLEYNFRVGTLPSPFNIFGAPLHLLTLALRKRCGKYFTKCAAEDRTSVPHGAGENRKRLMRNLRMRYWYRRYKPHQKIDWHENEDIVHGADNSLYPLPHDSGFFKFSRHMTSIRR